jgi:PKD repeat protein
VCVLELIDESIPAMDPRVEIRSATSVKAGESVAFGATASSGAAPVLACHWNVTHTFAHAGGYTVQVTTTGLGATTDRKSVTVSVSGEVSTQFEKDQKVRPAL